MLKFLQNVFLHKLLKIYNHNNNNNIMIIAHNIVGGLGNQLFQIFATIAYGMEHGRRIIFTYDDYTRSGLNRPTYWTNLLKYLQIFTTAFPNNKMTNQELVKLPKIMDDTCHNYVELKQSSFDAVQLFGYFQSPKYFEKYLDKILNLIHFSEIREEVLQENNYFFTDKSDTIYISMHFRIGDYKAIQHCHPIMKYDYYETALKRMVTELECQQNSLKVLYFYESQDTLDVKNIIDPLSNEFANIEFIPVGTGLEDWKQMILMTGCHHHIIANSTFSWWGAYLNPSASKIVYYPSVWFGPNLKHLRTDHLFPVDWIKN